MNAPNPDLILAGLGDPSLAFFAPQGTALPSNATTALTADYLSAGIVAASGAEIGYSSEKVEIDQYGSVQAARTIITKETTTFKLIMRQTDPVTQAIYRRLPLVGTGAPTVTTAGAMTVTDGPARSISYAGVLHTVDGLNVIRKTFGRLTPTGRDPEVIKLADNVFYGVEFTAEPDGAGISQTTYYILNALKTA